MQGRPKRISAIPLNQRLLNLRGISIHQIREHYEFLYLGYVDKINEIWSRMRAAPREGDTTYSPYRSLKIAETYAYNGVKLHEMYFQNLGGSGGHPKGRLYEDIVRSFGSFEYWEDDFITLGLSMRGWAILSYDPRDRGLHNYGLDTHNLGVVIRSIPILVLDVYEHAYFIDYGARRKLYIEAFMKNIDWEIAQIRYDNKYNHIVSSSE